MRNPLLVISLCLLTLPALASGTLDLQERSFDEQVSQIRADLADGETYSEIGADDRHTVNQLLDRIGMKLERAGSIDNLPEYQRVDIFNDQERINTILTRGMEDSRMDCRRERVTGTNRLTSVCMTVADRRRAREQGRDYMRMQRSPTMPEGN